MLANLPNLDAASLIAMPASSPSKALQAAAVSTASRLCETALGSEALLSHVWECEFGKIGVIIIPVVDVKLFENNQRSLRAALKGVELAAELGARCVSFTGMIPAATGYARDIVAAVPSPGPHPMQFTTGHASVVAAFALNVERLLDFAGRDYREERVAFVGLGSIGQGIARLMATQAAPRHIYLVDVTEQRVRLEQLKAVLVGEHGLAPATIEVVTVEKGQSVPARLYAETTLFLSATSAPEVIDIDALEPGTLIVDDSFPLGYNADKAAERVERSGDIMITIAGGFESPTELELIYAPDPKQAELAAVLGPIPRIANPWPNCMTGCVYSALLTPHFDLPATLGPVELAGAERSYRTLHAENFTGTPPYFITFGSERTDPICVLEAPNG